MMTYLRSLSVNCKWQGWVEIGECSKTCGGGKQTITRTKKVEAANGGTDCTGKSVTWYECNTRPCYGKGY